MTNGRTHRPEHDAVLCETCGACTWSCPAAVFADLASEEGSLRGAVFSARPYPGAKAAVPPCRAACPLGQDVPGYISAVARGFVVEAGEIVRRTNALPSVCGRLCIASCTKACVRARIDDGLDIRGLKRFAATAAKATAAKPASGTGRRVAIVGGGPAGLAAAHRLAQLGLSPVVFEAGPTAGGMLADAVPAFALPRDVLESDVEALVEMGVEIRCNARVGVDVAWEELER
ncbi:MAG: NAD(P)-binding protein, partial [Deltaproteobacteria bacterium]|nr:NAD(P)-binding protein [Deltaproteobacteria bacterium]